MAPQDRTRTISSVAAQRGVAPSWLHDHTLQALEYIAAGGYRDDADLGHLREVAAGAADELRHVLEGRRRRARDLVPALAETVADAQTLAGPLQILLSVEGLERPVAPRLAETLAEAVTEALTNVRKHAGARHALVRGTDTADGVVVTIADDGRGFDPAGAAVGMGLRHSIIGRLAAAGGTAIVESRPGEGTCVTLHLPTVRRPVDVPELMRSAS